MKWLFYKLWKENNALRPSRGFRSALWKKLDSAWQEIYQPKVFWYQMPVFKYSLVALVVLIVVGSTGVGAYAYNSPEVTEGTRLYGIKRAIERVEEKVVERRAPEIRAKFYLKQIERRETEKQVMVRRGRTAEQTENKKLEKKQNLNLNQKPYEESNTSAGTGDVVGDSNAGAGRETRRQGETKGQRASDTDADTE